jgi:hypothetical protein
LLLLPSQVMVSAEARLRQLVKNKTSHDGLSFRLGRKRR